MHAVTHSLAQRAPPATRARARWQPYSAIQTLSARASPAGYLNTPSSVASSNSPTPLLSSLCEHDRPRHTVMAPRELSQAQKSRYVVGLVDQAVKSLCDIWHSQDIPLPFTTGSRGTTAGLTSLDLYAPIVAPCPTFKPHNSQLPSPITPSTQPSPATSSFPHSEQCIAQPTQLVPLKGFVHEVLRRSRTSGSVLQTALCYLEAIRSKVPELVEKERNGAGVQGEVDLSGRIVQGDLEAEEWRELALDSVMANFIHLDAAEDLEPRVGGFPPTTRTSDSHEAPRSLLAPSRLSADTSLTGLKSHIAQNLVKKPKTPSGPLPPMPPLPSPLLCPRRTFLASLILASKFTQDRCYSNKAWAKLSGLPPREIGRCERALGDALEWRLWVGKTPPVPSSNRAITRCKSDGELFTAVCEDALSRSSSVSTYTPGAGLRRSSTLPASGFCQDPFAPTQTAPEASWELLAWPSASFATPAPSSSSSSPSTPPLSHSPSSTDSSSGDRTIQMASFVDMMPSPGQTVRWTTTCDKEPGNETYAIVDAASGLSFPMYAHGLDNLGPYPTHGAVPEQIYGAWTTG